MKNEKFRITKSISIHRSLCCSRSDVFAFRFPRIEGNGKKPNVELNDCEFSQRGFAAVGLFSLSTIEKSVEKHITIFLLTRSFLFVRFFCVFVSTERGFLTYDFYPIIERFARRGAAECFASPNNTIGLRIRENDNEIIVVHIYIAMTINFHFHALPIGWGREGGERKGGDGKALN